MRDTQLITDNHVLYCQSHLIGELLSRGALTDDCVMMDDDILEWWLVTPWLARRLQDNDQTVIEQYGCHWWGRTTSGQAVYMDEVIRQIAAD